MIIVEEVSKEIIDKKIRLSCKFTDNGVEDILWFETSIENEVYLNTNICDSFFVVLFLRSIHTKQDIYLKSPVSRRLLYGVENYLVDILIMMNPGYRRINIDAPISEKTFPEANGIATAMSLGIDSFYTLAKNNKGHNPVTHLTLYNAGAFGTNGGKEARKLFYSIINQAKALADHLQMPLIWVDTNLNEILDRPFVPTHTFRNLACSLLFQNIFKTYYYSSGHNIKDFRVDPSDTANYDLIIAVALSSNSLNFEIFGLMANRVEKTKEIMNYKPAQDHLNVCIVTTEYDHVKIQDNKIKNCSNCYKCVRTMLALDIAGKLEPFSNVFDIYHFKTNKNKFLAETIYHYLRSKNTFSAEILNECKKQNYKIPPRTYYHLLLRCFHPIKQRLNIPTK
ncbi:hypothetical protein RM553_05470 [Zunongwangia sp. F363]|uniref:Uncharacterized protein n=1 Tax=Autumnicola tepida TaxID=3075595 RepID=A0ABU3C7G1_9FLAO|nr:hypothetical protein [Zunongwangia sp. F363]MDT0642278.1 hypothetical protein [Zunongwangia sp. F363]